jgi:DNA-binding response OmpR family regulator
MSRDRFLRSPERQHSSGQILHVDDDPATRDAVRGILSAHHEIVSASGLTDALDLAREHGFGLYLLGGMFQDGSSLELCYELRLLDPVVPVLIHSLLPKELRQRLLTAGATEIVDRAASPEALTDAVRRHLDGVSQSQRRRIAISAG